ncbi:holin [Corynebacterium lizhenjunii]|uniref:Holin n=1 Tax=Corynebacterium lizhenjunii TaxID=2709394 RepID=A0A7T0KD26_9CORY|nr:holin [Corynebacterium lizhenjunii]QPK78254.1 holin [Corynebacterium lizhenjunii]
MSTHFLRDLAERALKTFAQSLLAVLTVGVPVWDLDWHSAIGIASTATIISILTSLASVGAGQPGTASLIDTTPTSGGRHRAGYDE